MCLHGPNFKLPGKYTIKSVFPSYLCSRPVGEASAVTGFLSIFSKICYLHACVQSCFSCVRLFVTPWTVACRLLCPWDFPGKNAGVGCHALLQGNTPDPRIKPVSPICRRCFTAELPGKPKIYSLYVHYFIFYIYHAHCYFICLAIFLKICYRFLQLFTGSWFIIFNCFRVLHCMVVPKSISSVNLLSYKTLMLFDTGWANYLKVLLK